jgi:hypothetical protein
MKLNYKDEVLKSIEYYVDKIEKAMKNKKCYWFNAQIAGLFLIITV